MKTYELRTEKGAPRSVELAGRSLGLPFSGKLRRVIASDGEDLLHAPSLVTTQRTGDHELAGLLGSGHTLERRRWSRLRLLGPSGDERLVLRSKAGRPTRGLRQSWDVQLPGGKALVLTDTRGVLDPGAWKRELQGDDVATYAAEGHRIVVGNGRASLEVQDGASLQLSDPLHAAATLWVVFDLHQSKTV